MAAVEIIHYVTIKVYRLQKFSKVCQVRRANNLATFMCWLSSKFWEPQPPEAPRVCPGLCRDCFTFAFIFHCASVSLLCQGHHGTQTWAAVLTVENIFLSQNWAVHSRWHHCLLYNIGATYCVVGSPTIEVFFVKLWFICGLLAYNTVQSCRWG